MKNIVHFLIAIVLLFSNCSPKSSNFVAKEIKQLKVLTYNIHHANPPSKPELIDIDAIATVIKRENPDIIAMQELDKFVPRSGNTDQAKLIADKIGMKYHFYKSIDYDGGEYGVAIFSKHKLLNIKQLFLPKADEKTETRLLAYADINFQGQKITIACTHLDARSETVRLLQAKAIVKELESVQHPIILAGDLNSSIGLSSIDFLLQHFKNSCTDNCGFTVPAVKPRRNIDFILTKNTNWKVKSYNVVDETYASDHRPVVATYEIQ